MTEEWVETTLGEVTKIQGGGTPSTKEAAFWNGDVIWLTPTEVVRADGQRVSSSERRISQEGLAHSSAKLLPPGTVLLTSRASVGFTAIADVPLTTNQGFQSLIPQGGVLSEFLMYWVQGNRDEFSRRAGGSTFPEISKTNVASIPIHIPPLPVQRRIADLMAHLDGHLARLEAEVRDLRRVRTCLCELLFRGGLREEGPRYSFTLGTICKLTSGFAFKSGEWRDSGTPVAQIANIKPFTVELDGCKFVDDKSATAASRFLARCGDLLVAMTGNVGTVARVSAEQDGLLVNQRVGLISNIDESSILPDWLFFCLNSPSALGLMSGASRQSIQANLSSADFASLRLTAPALNEQQEQVRILEDLHSSIAALEAEVMALTRLRSSAAHSLLSGRLLIAPSYDSLLPEIP